MRRTLAALLAVAARRARASPRRGRSTEAAGLRFSVPGDWARVPAPSDMRAAQFRVPHTGADAEDGELVLFFFGKGQGGSAEQNVERWTGQFTQPDGKPSKDAARGHDPHRQRPQADVGRRRRNLQARADGRRRRAPRRTGWRLLAAVVEGQGGPGSGA